MGSVRLAVVEASDWDSPGAKVKLSTDNYWKPTAGVTIQNFITIFIEWVDWVNLILLGFNETNSSYLPTLRVFLDVSRGFTRGCFAGEFSAYLLG